jgi:hypothetical protein
MTVEANRIGNKSTPHHMFCMHFQSYIYEACLASMVCKPSFATGHLHQDWDPNKAAVYRPSNNE